MKFETDKYATVQFNNTNNISSPKPLKFALFINYYCGKQDQDGYIELDTSHKKAAGQAFYSYKKGENIKKKTLI